MLVLPVFGRQVDEAERLGRLEALELEELEEEVQSLEAFLLFLGGDAGRRDHTVEGDCCAVGDLVFLHLGLLHT